MFKIELNQFEKLINVALKWKSSITQLQQQDNRVIISDFQEFIILPMQTSGENFTLLINDELTSIISFFKKLKVKYIDVYKDKIISETYKYDHNLMYEFELLPYQFKGNYIKLGGMGIIDQMIELLPFVSKDISRYILNGVAINDGGIVATDGKRLARFNFADNRVNFVLPDKSIININKLFSKCEISVDEKQCILCAKNDNIIYYTKTIEGNFPSWKLVIPKKIKFIYEFNGKDVFDKINLLKLKCKKNEHRSLVFNFKNNILSITNSVGISFIVNVKQMTNLGNINFTVNQNYFDFLKDKKQVIIKIFDSKNPIICDDSNMLVVVMPMCSN